MSLRRDLKIQELNQVTEIIYDQNLNVIVYVFDRLYFSTYPSSG